MRVLAAILLDSIYETLDRKVLYVLVGLSLLIVAVVASIDFDPIPFSDAVEEEWERVEWLAAIPRDGKEARAEFRRVLDVQSVDLPESDRAVVTVAIEYPEGARNWLAVRGQDSLGHGPGRHGGGRPGSPGIPKEIGPPLDPDEARSFFARLARSDAMGYDGVEDLGENRYRVRLSLLPPFEMSGAGRITLFFGALDYPLPEISYAQLLMMIQIGIASLIAGFFGLLVAVIVTAWSVPNMLQEGTIDLVASKPVPRTLLFFGKYLGGLVFVLAIAIVLIGGIWLVLSIRSGFYNFGFLGTILSVTSVFAILYSFGVFWAVLTRSPILAILMPIALWFSCWGLRTAMDFALLGPTIQRGLKAVYHVLPRTGDFDKLNLWLVTRAPISNLAREQILESSGYEYVTHGIALPWSIAGSFLFAGFVLAITAWLFHRRDF